MSFGTDIKEIGLDVLQITRRAGEIYLVADYSAGTPGNLFTITGGPVWIVGLFAHVTVLAENSGFTGAIRIAGVNAQAAAVVLNSTLNDIIMWPIEASGGSVIIPNFATTPMPTIGAGGNDFVGRQLASAGDIDLAVNNNLVSTLVFYILYYRMTHDSRIVVA